MSTLARAGEAKRKRQAFEKPEPVAPPVDAVEDDPPAAPPAAPKPTGDGSGRRSRSPGRRGTSTGTSTTVDADVETLLAEAAATAEAERAAAAEAVGVDPPGAKGPPMTKAERQRLRRLTLRHVAVEVTIMHGAKLDKLAEHYGTQRSALEAAIDLAFDAIEDDA